MQLTLKKEAAQPAAKNFLQQQSKFERFMRVFNHERPHEGQEMKYPAELYASSTSGEVTTFSDHPQSPTSSIWTYRR